MCSPRCTGNSRAVKSPTTGFDGSRATFPRGTRGSPRLKIYGEMEIWACGALVVASVSRAEVTPDFPARQSSSEEPNVLRITPIRAGILVAWNTRPGSKPCVGSLVHRR
jgi:hypothetical protein